MSPLTLIIMSVKLIRALILDLPRQIALAKLNYGFTFGGPVWIPKIYDGHDKAFFFFNFEQYRRSMINNNIPQTVPIRAVWGRTVEELFL